MNSRVHHLLAGNGDRKTRMHNERGDLIAARELLPGIASIATRWSRASRERPWMVPQAIEYLDRNLRSSDRLLEMGSGMSTAWYAARVASVISIEPDTLWMQKTSQILEALGTRNVTLLNLGISTAVRNLTEREEKFEVIIIDSADTETWDRVDGARSAKNLIADKGLIVLDDSDRPRYREADALLASYEIRRLRGMKSRPIVYTEATAYDGRANGVA